MVNTIERFAGIQKVTKTVVLCFYRSRLILATDKYTCLNSRMLWPKPKLIINGVKIILTPT